MKKIILSIMLVILIMITTSCMSNNSNDNALEENVVTVTDNVTNNATNEGSVDVTEKIEEYGEFTGYLWEVSDGKSKIYLYGSIHIADKSLYPLSKVVEDAFSDSDFLSVEADVSDQSSILALTPLLMYGDEDNIFNHLSEEGINKFETALLELGIKSNQFEKLNIWTAGSAVLQLQLMKAGYLGAEGIDMYFLNQAKKFEKKIIELEGMAFQIGIFNNLTDLEQEELFIKNLGTIEETTNEFEELLNAFISEDLNELEKFLMAEDEITLEDEKLEEELLLSRNIGMVEKIESYIQNEQNVFVVAGVMHFIGEGSIIELLEQEGYTIKRK